MTPDTHTPGVTAAARIQDATHLRTQYAALNRSLDARSLPVFNERIDALCERAGEMSHNEFVMSITHAVAAANDGHTDVLALEHFRRFPLRFHWFDGELRIVAATPAYARLLGGRIEAIGGVDTQRLYARIAPYIPGHEHRVRRWSTAYLSSPDALAGAGLLPHTEAVPLLVTSPDGTQATETVAGVAWGGPDIQHREWRNIVPGARPDGARGEWLHALSDDARTPLYLREPDRLYTHAWDVGQNTLYIRVSTTNNVGPTRLDDYLKAVLAEAAMRRPAHVIVDIRFNSGGMFSLIYPFTKGVHPVLAPGGRVFVITGIATFSAGICMLAFLKAFGSGRTTVVGEHVADNEQFWAEGDFVTLPNSGLKTTYVDGRFNLGAQSPDFHEYYWMNVVYGADAGGLAPDHTVTLSWQDYLAGRDPCMAWITAQIA